MLVLADTSDKDEVEEEQVPSEALDVNQPNEEKETRYTVKPEINLTPLCSRVAHDVHYTRASFEKRCATHAQP